MAAPTPACASQVAGWSSTAVYDTTYAKEVAAMAEVVRQTSGVLDALPIQDAITRLASASRANAGGYASVLLQRALQVVGVTGGKLADGSVASALQLVLYALHHAMFTDVTPALISFRGEDALGCMLPAARRQMKPNVTTYYHAAGMEHPDRALPSVGDLGAVLTALPGAAVDASRVLLRNGFERLFLPRFYADGRALALREADIIHHFLSAGASADSPDVTLCLLNGYLYRAINALRRKTSDDGRVFDTAEALEAFVAEHCDAWADDALQSLVRAFPPPVPAPHSSLRVTERPAMLDRIADLLGSTPAAVSDALETAGIIDRPPTGPVAFSTPFVAHRVVEAGIVAPPRPDPAAEELGVCKENAELAAAMLRFTVQVPRPLDMSVPSVRGPASQALQITLEDLCQVLRPPQSPLSAADIAAIEAAVTGLSQSNTPLAIEPLLDAVIDVVGTAACAPVNALGFCYCPLVPGAVYDNDRERAVYEGVLGPDALDPGFMAGLLHRWWATTVGFAQATRHRLLLCFLLCTPWFVTALMKRHLRRLTSPMFVAGFRSLLAAAAAFMRDATAVVEPDGFECTVCFDTCPEEDVVRFVCGAPDHALCKQCWLRHVTSKLDSSTSLECLQCIDPRCTAEMRDPLLLPTASFFDPRRFTVLPMHLTSMIAQRRASFFTRREVQAAARRQSKDKKRRREEALEFHPRLQLRRLVAPAPAGPEYTEQLCATCESLNVMVMAEDAVLSCVACGAKTCLVGHHPSHPGKLCAEAAPGGAGTDPVEVFRNELLQRCPGCGIATHKAAGCNHMTCRCGHQWCWLCRERYTSGHFRAGGGGCRDAWMVNPSAAQHAAQERSRVLLALDALAGVPSDVVEAAKAIARAHTFADGCTCRACS